MESASSRGAWRAGPAVCSKKGMVDYFGEQLETGNRSKRASPFASEEQLFMLHTPENSAKLFRIVSEHLRRQPLSVSISTKALSG